jgi:hypothetical protein
VYCMDAVQQSAAAYAHAAQLSDAELQTAAMACRAMAYQEGERAKVMENPDIKRPIQATAEQSAKLA